SLVSAPAERPAFEAVARTSIDPVFRYLAGMCGSREDAEDLTAQAFEQAQRRWSRFDPQRGEPLPWLLAIARRVALDHFRSEGRRRRRERVAAEDPALTREATPDPAAAGSLSPELRAALTRLTRGERELVALRVILELDAAETAALVGSTPGAVSSGLHRALAKLRREVSRDAPR
ncbi:MAG: RNA polymerase sigma factor, partial [Miltoncostaeaceae bacterium]